MIRVAVIASSFALRAGLRALIAADAEERRGNRNGEAGVAAIEAASLSELSGGTADVDVLLLASEAFDEIALRRLLENGDARLGVLALSDERSEAPILAALPLNGWGVLPMDVTVEELQAGIQAVAQGLVIGTAALFGPAMSRMQAGTRPLAAGADDPNEFRESLTQRESQVLQHLARGLANKQIALALGISEHTVKFHVSSIYAKLGANNRTEAVRNGIQLGLVFM